MKTFYNKVNSVICFAKETRTSIVLIIEGVQSVLQNCENRILSEVRKLTKKSASSHSIVYHRCD